MTEKTQISEIAIVNNADLSVKANSNFDAKKNNVLVVVNILQLIEHFQQQNGIVNYSSIAKKNTNNERKMHTKDIRSMFN